QFFVSELASHGITAVAFSEGVSLEELTRLVVLLSAREAGRTIPFEEAVRTLREAGVAHITLEANPPEDEEAGPYARLVKVYFLGIRMLREIIDQQKREGGFSIGLARRWIQAMIRHLEEDESFCLGLTTMKNAEGYHANHGVNVAVLATALGRRLNLPRRDLMDLGVSALLHDFGTLEVSPAILEKPAVLTGEERAALNKQSRQGAQTLIPLQTGRVLPVKALEVAMEHRQSMDPARREAGRAGRTIHLFSRIVRIADVYDAMTTKRVYRPQAFAPAEALKMMSGEKGRDFDPLLLKAFAAMLGPYPVGSLVVLDGGEIGLVMAIPSHPALSARPEIKLITDADGLKIDGPVIHLAEAAAAKQGRAIVLGLNAEAYGVRPIEYFLARARHDE
ncbi:MAG: HD domain-containing protein, partial [Acidobacteriota bacterium]|nr:HD domain-containing protein [Acidobacteriota bacterium]